MLEKSLQVETEEDLALSILERIQAMQALGQDGGSIGRWLSNEPMPPKQKK